MNILILSHFYTPYSSVGAKRMEALSVFLNRKGEKVFVLSANPCEYGDAIIKDKRIEKGIKVFRLNRAFRNLVLKKVFRIAQYWIKTRQIINEKKIDVLIISAGPFNYLEIICKVKKKFPNVKCVIDFRDILDGSQCKKSKPSFLESVGYRFDIKTEERAVQKADVCLTVSEQMRELYKKRYPRQKDSFICIRNGYDDITVSDDTKRSIEEYRFEGSISSKYLSVGVFGKYGFYNEEYYDILADSIRVLKNKGIRITIVQFGVREGKLENALRCSDAEQYRFVETSGYQRDILELQKCDAVIATNILKEALGTKIFDYIWINRPIITINPYKDGEQAKLTRKFENGFVCTSKEELTNSLTRIAQSRKRILDSNIEKRIEYGRAFQFEILYSFLKGRFGELIRNGQEEE